MVNQSSLSRLEDLRTFVTIVEAGSLAAAAALLGLTPNAVSRRLGQLEQRLGTRLIHRTTRRMNVTDEGHRFHARCRRVLDELDDAERELAGGTEIEGTLRVAVHGELVGPRLLAAFGEMLAAAPNLHLQIHVDNRFRDPIRWGLDLGICLGEPPVSSLAAIALGDLVWGLAATPAYLERQGRPRSPEALAGHECLRVLRDRPETHWTLRKAGGRARRFPIGGRFETSDGAVLSAALRTGIGIGVLLKSSLDAAVREGVLEPVLPEWQWGSMPLYALLPRGQEKIPRVQAALDVLRKATAGLA